jgi:uncharacterized protein YqiB (DUF1249 family)
MQTPREARRLENENRAALAARPICDIVGAMFNDSLTPVSWRARPRSFVALMSLYESNFVRLGWLAGDVAALHGEYRSRSRAECELILTVLENSRYTTTLNLTYLLPRSLPESLSAGGFERVPDMQLRVYHDAHLAEAQDGGVAERLSGPTVVRGRPGSVPERELGRRWQRNMMLNKWLEYCVERGHRFPSPG